MEGIRLATPEEIEAVKENSDLDFAQAIFTWGKNKAVIKQVPELDPVYFTLDESHSRRALFIWGMENILKGMGARAYYFHVHTRDEAWCAAVEKWGAERLSTEPEYHYKKKLV